MFDLTYGDWSVSVGGTADQYGYYGYTQQTPTQYYPTQAASASINMNQLLFLGAVVLVVVMLTK